MGGEEKRHQMMQNLFGDQSEEEEEEEIDSEHESNPQPAYLYDEGEEGPDTEGEGEADMEGQGEAEVESEGEELREVEPDPGESEGERDQSSQEVDARAQREESEERETDSEEKEEYGQRAVTSRRHDIVQSGSERSEEGHHAENEDEEVDQARSSTGSPQEEKDQAQISHSAPEIRDVFGDSDDEEQAEYAVRNEIEQDAERSSMEEQEEQEEAYRRNLRPEDMLPDEDAQYESEEENIEVKPKEKPVGPPLELGIPFEHPPAHPDKMNMIRVSNIMGIEPKPFDPETFQEEDTFVTDESGSKKRIRLDDNIVRWRIVKNSDGTETYESNARFVRWSDGSLQLLIGNEVLDISVQDAQHDQAHLFLRHGKGILQSQGRLLKKMRFMPSSLTSNSHRLLTALVESRHKKVYKVKNCITDIDPEREKEEKEKAANHTIRANELLRRKREKVSRKYTPTVDRGRQLSPGMMNPIIMTLAAPVGDTDTMMTWNWKLEQSDAPSDIPRKSSLPAVKSSRRPVDFSDSEREESEYETDGEEEEERFHPRKISPPRKRADEREREYEEEEEQYEEEAAADGVSEEEEVEAEEPKQKVRESSGVRKRKGIASDEDSPPRKVTMHRRMAVVYDSDED
ncbi:Leo1-like protein [Dillenia turbinata]|uniref:Leo1-like protein n=1 Tax=Dillenia turbinata TaxID=194707 RepID=A0AAN8V7R1_9MAGN